LNSQIKGNQRPQCRTAIPVVHFGGLTRLGGAKEKEREGLVINRSPRKIVVRRKEFTQRLSGLGEERLQWGMISRLSMVESNSLRRKN